MTSLVDHRQGGFSLLEILVAFTILAISLGVLFQIYSRGAQTATLTEAYTEAVMVAQSQLATIDAIDNLEPGESSGNTEQGMEWQVRISEFNDPGAEDEKFQSQFALVQIDVDVMWQNQGKDKKFSLQTLRLVNK